MSLIRWKRPQFTSEHKDWTLEQRKKVMWFDESRFNLYQSDWCIRIRGEADEVKPTSYLTSLWGQCYDLGWIQLVRSPHYLLYWRTWFFHQWIFFLPWWHGRIPGWQCHSSLVSNCEGVVQGAWDIIFHTWIGRHRVQILTPLRIFGMGCRRRRGLTLSPSIQDLGENVINATLDWNKHCDTV